MLAACIARRIVLTPLITTSSCASGDPTPSVDTTASWPGRACAIAAASPTSPRITRSAVWAIDSLAASRIKALTLWPRASASRTTARPVCPEAPNTRMFIFVGLPLNALEFQLRRSASSIQPQRLRGNSSAVSYNSSLDGSHMILQGLLSERHGCDPMYVLVDDITRALRHEFFRCGRPCSQEGLLTRAYGGHGPRHSPLAT